MLLSEALVLFLTQIEADGRSIHTIQQYRRHVRALAAWLAVDREVAEIRPDDLARFLVPGAGSRARKATSKNALRSSLRGFFGYLHRSGHVAQDPSRLLRLARCSPPPPRALSEDEVGRLRDALAGAPARDRVLIELLLRTGIRIGSAVALDKADVDLERGELSLWRTKGDRPVTLPMPAGLVETLRAYLVGVPEGPLFRGRGDRRVTVRHVQRRFAEARQRGGLRPGTSPHALRHTFATRLYQRTGDVFLVKEALSHRAIASTMVYARMGESRLREALG